MARFRPLAYLAVALALVVVTLARAADPPAGGKPAAIKVKVEKDDGTTVEGTLASPALQIDTDFGRLDLQLSRVKVIDFADTPDGPVAVVELSDGQHLRGTPTAKELAFAGPDGSPAPVKIADVREMKIVRDADHSLLGLLFGLVALSALEIVLGIDNVIFLAIVAGKLPKERQPQARRIGLGAALGTRILLLFSLSWLLGLTKPVVTLPIPGLMPDAAEVSWRDIILLAGGAFLIYKSVREMHEKLEHARKAHAAATSPEGGSPDGTPAKAGPPISFAKVIAQIAVIDIVFSLDSVITAVGVVDNVYVMITAMVVAMLVMLVSAGPISEFVEKHPTVKILALAFLILIGVLLVAEGFGQHINKGYIYFAMAFAVVIEFVNMRMRPKGVSEMIAEQ